MIVKRSHYRVLTLDENVPVILYCATGYVLVEGPTRESSLVVSLAWRFQN